VYSEMLPTERIALCTARLLQDLAKGEKCVVAGSDMAALRDRLRRAGVQ